MRTKLKDDEGKFSLTTHDASSNWIPHAHTQIRECSHALQIFHKRLYHTSFRATTQTKSKTPNSVTKRDQNQLI